MVRKECILAHIYIHIQILEERIAKLPNVLQNYSSRLNYVKKTMVQAQMVCPSRIHQLTSIYVAECGIKRHKTGIYPIMDVGLTYRHKNAAHGHCL